MCADPSRADNDGGSPASITSRVSRVTGTATGTGTRTGTSNGTGTGTGAGADTGSNTGARTGTRNSHGHGGVLPAGRSNQHKRGLGTSSGNAAGVESDSEASRSSSAAILPAAAHLRMQPTVPVISKGRGVVEETEEEYAEFKELQNTFKDWVSKVAVHGIGTSQSMADLQHKVMSLLETCASIAEEKGEASRLQIFRHCIDNMKADVYRAACCTDIYALSTLHEEPEQRARGKGRRHQ